MNQLISSIKSKIILAVILIVSAGFVTYEAYEFTEMKQAATAELHELADRTAVRLAESMVLPVWEIDKQWVASIIESEMQDKQLFAVIVYADGELFEGRERDNRWQSTPSANQFDRDYITASREIMRDGSAIGSVKVYITTRFMNDEIQTRLIDEAKVLLLVALLIVITLVALIDRVIVRALQQLLKQTQAIAEGDYSQSIQLPQKDEMGRLSESIDRMKESIQLREAERNQALDLVRESEARFKGLAQQVPVSLCYVAKSGDIEFMNSRFTSTFGYTLEDIPTIEQWWPLAYPDESYRAWVLETWDAACQQAITQHCDIDPIEYRVKCKNGDVKTIEISGVFLGEDLLATLVDMTERIESEANIRKLSLAVEQSGEAIMITDLQGTIEYVNPAFTEMTGYDKYEAVGQKPSLLKSGNQSEAYYKSMWDRLADGKVWHGKVVNRKKSGDFYPAMLTISPIKNEQGEITNYIALQQSLEELEALEAQFHQSQKMEAIGTLVGGIAHDFNNNLAGITGNLYLAKKAAKDMPEIGRRLENVEKLAFGAAATIQQLLAFSRKGVVQMHPLSIASFLKETIKLSEISLPENIAFKLNVNDPDMKINGDITQLQQVLMNLINNAHDAVDDCNEPCISISLHRFHADKQFIAMHEGLREGEYACIEVSDNGCGMSEENVQHIFEPFFTTKELGKGTGLGLAMVYGAVKTHGGVIDVQSAQGEASGTIMQIYLPLIESDALLTADVDMDQVVSGQGETILLVDDNQTVLETGRDVLEGLGYQVLTAEDGESAIEVYKTHMSEIDMIILDVVMPKLGGVEALQAIRDFNPEVKAMFATGYDKASTLGGMNQSFKERVISKPFAMSKLSQMIREVLES